MSPTVFAFHGLLVLEYHHTMPAAATAVSASAPITFFAFFISFVFDTKIIQRICLRARQPRGCMKWQGKCMKCDIRCDWSQGGSRSNYPKGTGDSCCHPCVDARSGYGVWLMTPAGAVPCPLLLIEFYGQTVGVAEEEEGLVGVLVGTDGLVGDVAGVQLCRCRCYVVDLEGEVA